ncbi:hypothetical protein CHS0354_038074 [Potamilus streckersoni]|uniref:Uncharacterized protein n=1 Tax=Potamilus streckersoni TaxID=2493646 RepID=A0AAE0W064_9BIVA|nr:hypothetical protein CHS0354_038074 [Potamilus streckersoni]
MSIRPTHVPAEKSQKYPFDDFMIASEKPERDPRGPVCYSVRSVYGLIAVTRTHSSVGRKKRRLSLVGKGAEFRSAKHFSTTTNRRVDKTRRVGIFLSNQPRIAK